MSFLLFENQRTRRQIVLVFSLAFCRGHNTKECAKRDTLRESSHFIGHGDDSPKSFAVKPPTLLNQWQVFLVNGLKKCLAIGVQVALSDGSSSLARSRQRGSHQCRIKQGASAVSCNHSKAGSTTEDSLAVVVALLE